MNFELPIPPPPPSPHVCSLCWILAFIHLYSTYQIISSLAIHNSINREKIAFPDKSSLNFDIWNLLLGRNILLLISDLSTKLHPHLTFLAEVMDINGNSRLQRSLTFDLSPFCFANIDLLISNVLTKLHHHWAFLAEVIGKNTIFDKGRWALTFHPSCLAEIFLFLLLIFLQNYITIGLS